MIPTTPLRTVEARHHYTIWSDDLLAADTLQARLRDMGHEAEIVQPDTRRSIDILIVMRHRSAIDSGGLTEWLELANKARVDIFLAPRALRQKSSMVICTVGMDWNGEIRQLHQSASFITGYSNQLAKYSVQVPRLIGVRGTVGSDFYCSDALSAITLIKEKIPRLLLIDEHQMRSLRSSRRAVNRDLYDLNRIVRWNCTRQSHNFIHTRVANASISRSPYPGTGTSLREVLQDERATSLILLLGEPGAGKTLQLKYLEAESALASLCANPREHVLRTFYVPLSEQPTDPDITLSWLDSRWRSAVDVNEWCTFNGFLEGGGVLLLDGLNEGTMRAIELDQWMMQWRDVVSQAFDKGANRIVVTCRTRDQLIPMRSARDEEPTFLTLPLLTALEIETMAVQRNPEAAAHLRKALDDDPSLLELYSHPFRLDIFLESGTATVARNDASLVASGIAAAILREREQLNFHGSLIPERSAAALLPLEGRSELDAWALLREIPIIRALAKLARSLTMREEADQIARLRISRNEAREILASSLRAMGIDQLDATHGLEAAEDLHVLVETSTPLGPDVGFSHGVVQALFSADGCSTADIVGIVQRASSVKNEQPDKHRMTGGSFSALRELIRMSALLKGDSFLEALGQADPVMAAEIYEATRQVDEPDTASMLIDRLHAALSDMAIPEQRSKVISALGQLGWRQARIDVDLSAATCLIPARAWKLGPSEVARGETVPPKQFSSEKRSVELGSFRIQCFPVTNSEFSDFISDGGYSDRAWWTDQGWDWRVRTRAVERFVADWSARRDTLIAHPERVVRLLRERKINPASAAAILRLCDFSDGELLNYARRSSEFAINNPAMWGKTPFNGALQPVVGISWFEANAYCKWLSRKTGLVVRLPSEDEWEAACVWAYQKRFGTGDDGNSLFARGAVNTVERHLDQTNPIGAFENSSIGLNGTVSDVLGNCFEWVFDSYMPGDHERKSLKGGSWRQEAWRAWPWYRGRGNAGVQNDDIGFRCVVSGAQNGLR